MILIIERCYVNKKKLFLENINLQQISRQNVNYQVNIKMDGY